MMHTNTRMSSTPLLPPCSAVRTQRASECTSPPSTSLVIKTSTGRCVSLLNDESSESVVEATCRRSASVPELSPSTYSPAGSPFVLHLQTPMATETLPSLTSLVQAAGIVSAQPAGVYTGGHAAGGAQRTTTKRKYKCTHAGCGKAFTTSGHLARHQRIHTGEKNFPCLFPGCTSRFSRQDNMMQHYRTHLSSKSRRSGSVATPRKVVFVEPMVDIYRGSPSGITAGSSGTVASGKGSDGAMGLPGRGGQYMAHPQQYTQQYLAATGQGMPNYASGSPHVHPYSRAAPAPRHSSARLEQGYAQYTPSTVPAVPGPRY